jgi:methylmalonyl-CoA mutase N-terminal domain/subunit
VIAHESGVANTVDPLGGSWFVEQLTDATEEEAYAYFRRIDDLGGVLPAIETGFPQREIADAAFRYQRETDRHERTVVGVNDFVSDESVEIPILAMDPAGYERQVARLQEVRRTRDGPETARALRALEQACRGDANVMPPLIEAVSAEATLQECCDVMRQVFGAYTEAAFV